MTLQKTTIEITVFSDGSYTPETIAQIAQDINDGDCTNIGEYAGSWRITNTEHLSPMEMYDELKKVHSDPSSLLGEDHPLVTMDTRTRNAIRLAKKFEWASYGKMFIEVEDLESVGLTMPKQYTDFNWAKFCTDVYKQITGEDLEPSQAIGRGFQSQYYGRNVSDALKAKFVPEGIDVCS